MIVKLKVVPGTDDKQSEYSFKSLLNTKRLIYYGVFIITETPLFINDYKIEISILTPKI